MTLPRVECGSGHGGRGLRDQLWGDRLNHGGCGFVEARISTVCEQHQRVVSGYLVRFIDELMSSFFRLSPPQQQSMIE